MWNKFSWPKYNFFMWLVVQNRCLTWENLCKCGFLGPLCVFCVVIVRRVFLIFSFSALSPVRFGTFGGVFGIRLVGMSLLLLRILFFRLPGFLDPLSSSGIFGWRGIVRFFMMLGSLFNTCGGKLFILFMRLPW